MLDRKRNVFHNGKKIVLKVSLPSSQKLGLIRGVLWRVGNFRMKE